MESFLSVVWICVPWALLGAGSPLLLAGLVIEFDGITRPLHDPAKVLTWVRGFRLSMIGLALAGTGAGWLLDQTWLIVLSLAIGGEETLESTVMHFALTRGRDPSAYAGPLARKPWHAAQLLDLPGMVVRVDSQKVEPLPPVHVTQQRVVRRLIQPVSLRTLLEQPVCERG
jgi:hypothetical protein